MGKDDTKKKFTGKDEVISIILNKEEPLPGITRATPTGKLGGGEDNEKNSKKPK